MSPVGTIPPDFVTFYDGRKNLLIQRKNELFQSV
jgi:hypothetical protein